MSSFILQYTTMISVLLLLPVFINVLCYDRPCQICQATPANSLLQVNNEMQTNGYWIVQSMMCALTVEYVVCSGTTLTYSKVCLAQFFRLIQCLEDLHICQRQHLEQFKMNMFTRTHLHIQTHASSFVFFCHYRKCVFSINHHLSIGMIFLSLCIVFAWLVGVNHWYVCVCDIHIYADNL